MAQEQIDKLEQERVARALSLFDDPPVADSPDMPSVDADWDGDDDGMLLSLTRQAFVPAELVDPVEMLGERGVKEAVNADPVNGGLAVIGEARFDWDYAMTPGQRARALAANAFGSRMEAFVKETAESAAGMHPADPLEYARQVAARRNGRL